MGIAPPFLDLDTLLYRVVAFIIAITLHDCFQSGIAAILGDPTARENGRLTLNPFAHIDGWGLAVILFGPYGWSRQVPVNPERFRRNPRFCGFLTYLLGPLFYFAMGLFFWWLYFTVPFADTVHVPWFLVLLKWVLNFCFIVNILLCILNLLPFYPMDMWKGLMCLLPQEHREKWKKFQALGIPVLLILMVAPFGQHALEQIFYEFSGWIMQSYGD